MGPVAQLRDVALRLSEGDYSARADLKTGDELQVPAGAYNSMTNHIIESYQATVKTLAEALRRALQSHNLFFAHLQAEDFRRIF